MLTLSSPSFPSCFHNPHQTNKIALFLSAVFCGVRSFSNAFSDVDHGTLDNTPQTRPRSQDRDLMIAIL